MEAKYYTPSLEEFYIGFEYEAPNYIESKDFKPQVFNPEDFIGVEGDLFLQDWIDVGAIRVKYLDAQDIEELGFKFFINKYIIPTYKKDCWRLYWFENNMVSIEKFYKEEKEQYFRGWIKNKSELKKVLKMLNIK